MQDPNQRSGDWQHVPSTNAAETPVAPAYPLPAQSGSYPPPAGAYAPPGQAGPAYAQPAVAGSQADGLSPNAAAAISYITIIPAILFLVMDPYKQIPLVRFHAMQCLFFNGVVFAFYMVCGIVWGVVLHLIPLLAIVGLLFWPAMGLVFLAVWGFCVFKASQGEWFKLPVIGDFAMKQAKA